MLQPLRILLPALLAILAGGQSLQAAGSFLIFTPTTISLSGNSHGAVVTQSVTLHNSGTGPSDWAIGVDPTAPWLTVSPSSGKGLAAGAAVTITVTANPVNLTVNANPGFRANITAQGTDNSATLGVTFSVSGTSIVVVPNPIAVSVLAGTKQTFTNLAQINGVANVSISVTSGGEWLSAVLASSLTPAPFSLVINAQTLPPSTTPYQGNLVVQCIGSVPCIPQNVPVALTVYAPVTLSCTPTQGPSQVGVAYSTNCSAAGGSGSYLWNIASGALPAGVTLSSFTGNNIQISGTPTSPGAFSYTVRVAENNARGLFASQSFNGSIAPGALPTGSVTPASVSFGTFVVGGPLPAAQSISVNSTNPSSGVPFSATPGSDCAWLNLSPTSGNTPAILSATVNTSQATPGNHACLITFNIGGISPNPTVTATLVVTGPTPILTASPSAVSFGSYTAGGALPAAQRIVVNSENPTSNLPFTSTFGPDCAWLTLSPASGLTPATIAASVNASGATSGSHSCLITFNANGVASGPMVTATITIAPGNQPLISAIVNGAGFNPGPIATGSWAAIFGTNLATVARQWDPATEIVNGEFPTSLDGTSVTVNGRAAAVEYISPGQVNVQMPDDNAVGPVQVVVKTTAGTSAPYTMNYAEFAPGFFQATAPYLAAQHADGSYVGGYNGATPGKPGEVITLWGTGFGLSSTPVASGRLFSGANKLANDVLVTIGGQPARVDFAGIVAAGLVQINVQIPVSISNGDAAVLAVIGGVATQTSGNQIAVRN